ncbi:MAG: hypothetical protein FJ304_18770, partial [Planctomycetes bacterium]|nr:hypothetical protein [Planctomycetota bacterium]
MLGFMKCVVEGIAAVGVGGLLTEFVPGGKYVKAVAAHAIKRWREKNARKKLEDELKEMVAPQVDAAVEARLARQAVEEAAPHLLPREKDLVTQFIAAMPEAARTSFKRKDDPTGTSLPWGYEINDEDDVVKVLPQHAPRFVPGEWVPGREDNWKLEKRLGGGGFGEVWLARHVFNRRELPRAVKFCTDEKAKRKLVTHEKAVIERVMQHVGDHPNIVPLLECNLGGDAPWLMYEFVEGTTLASTILGWQKLAPADRLARAVAVLHPIASALARGHAVTPAAVVHRDLKPANVLMAGGVPRVTDYGIGGTAVEYLLAEEKVGTLASQIERFPSMLRGSYSLMYSSPQQRDGDKPHPRDDVHALGVLAYQALIGRVDKEVKGNWRDRLEADGVPAQLVRLIGRSTSDEFDDRPTDAREWESVLDELIPTAELFEEPRPLPKPKAASPAPKPVPAKPQAAPAPKSPARKGGDIIEFPIGRRLTMPFCWIPAGTAQLGSPLAEQNAMIEAVGSRPDWLAAESEARRGEFTTKGFWLAKYPVTQAEWYALMGDSPSYFMAGNAGAAEVKGIDTTRFPVEQVSWDMIRAKGGFLDKLNALGGTEKVFGKASTFALPPPISQMTFDFRHGMCAGTLGFPAFLPLSCRNDRGTQWVTAEMTPCVWISTARSSWSSTARP